MYHITEQIFNIYSESKISETRFRRFSDSLTALQFKIQAFSDVSKKLKATIFKIKEKNHVEP